MLAVKTAFALLLIVSATGCTQSSQTAQTQTAPEPSQATAQASQNGSALTGKYTCETLAYQPAGVLEFEGSNYKLGTATGTYAFDGKTVTWQSGELASQFGDSVYNEQGKSIALQSKTDDHSEDKVCKPQE